jgi:hypothetical protein
MSLSSAPGGGGNIIFQGLVRDPSLIVRMEYGLRSKHHAVHSRRIQEGARREDPLHGVFDTSIYVVKRTRDEYRPPAEKP